MEPVPSESEADKLQPVSVEVPEENTTAGALGVAPSDASDKPSAAEAVIKAGLPATVRPLEEERDGGAGVGEEGEGDLSVSQVELELNRPRIVEDGKCVCSHADHDQLAREVRQSCLLPPSVPFKIKRVWHHVYIKLVLQLCNLTNPPNLKYTLLYFLWTHEW